MMAFRKLRVLWRWRVVRGFTRFTWQHRLFFLLQAAVAIFAGWLWLHLQAPGWAVAVLATVAAAMSVHGDMRGWQKSIWMMLIGFLLVIELRSINKDRRDAQLQAQNDKANQEKAFKEVLDQQNRDFLATADGLSNAYAQSQLNFKATIEQSNTILGSTRDAVESITGGKRVVAMQIAHIRGDTFTPYVFAPQPGIVRNVQARVVNVSLFEKDVKDKPLTMENAFAHDMNFSIGDIGPSEARWIQPPIALGPGDSVRFNIFFSGLNGFWNENLWVRKKRGEWLEALRVFRPYTKLANQTERDVVYQRIDKGFLEPGEKLDWNVMPQ